MNTYFIVYLIGYGLMIAAVWFGLDAAGVSQTWQIVAVLFLLGLGIVYAFSRAQTDTTHRDQARGNQAGGAQGSSQAGGQTGGQTGGAPQQSGQQDGGQQPNNPPA